MARRAAVTALRRSRAERWRGRSPTPWRPNGACCWEVSSAAPSHFSHCAAENVPELALLVIACGIGTYVWRGVGLLISGQVRADRQFFLWAGCVAYAMIAGLTVRIMLVPGGTLADTRLWERLVACALALAVYFIVRRNLFVGIATGFAVLVALSSLRHPL